MAAMTMAGLLARRIFGTRRRGLTNNEAFGRHRKFGQANRLHAQANVADGAQTRADEQPADVRTTTRRANAGCGASQSASAPSAPSNADGRRSEAGGDLALLGHATRLHHRVCIAGGSLDFR
jgi:hypothetical protein